VPLALITLGVVFLLSNLVPDRARGGLILFGLGAAFMVGRLTTGRYGYSVPAGILMAIGTFVGLVSVLGLHGISSAGAFFVLLGLGFGAVYLIGLQPGSVWPLFPAAILTGLGVVLLGVSSLGPLASMSWIVSYWPVALVLLGLWLLFRESLPAGLRKPIGTLGGLALLAYGILAAAASVAAGGTLARTGMAPGFGTSPFADTVQLDKPISPGQTFTVVNTNGSTTIHGGSGSSVHVEATRHFNMGGQGPDVQLNPDPNGLTLDANTPHAGFPNPFGQASSVDYVIDVPSSVLIDARSASGKLQVDGTNSQVQASTTSGELDLSNLSGSAGAKSASGVINLDNVAGQVSAMTNSGRIRGTQLQHVQTVQSASGSISLEGIFTDPAQVSATSGSITLRLLPGSAVQLDVESRTGSVEPQGLTNLSGGQTRRDMLTGALGDPAPGATLKVQTNSGNIRLSQ
jgi:hypothetical protein